MHYHIRFEKRAKMTLVMNAYNMKLSTGVLGPRKLMAPNGLTGRFSFVTRIKSNAPR